MSVFNSTRRQTLLEYANLCESAKIDAAWIAGIRKSWKQVIDPVKRLAARAPHHETKIDINKIYKTADESVAVLNNVRGV
jgi:hypothetical protein